MDGLDSSHIDSEANSFSLFDASDDDFLVASSAGEANAIDNPGTILDEGKQEDKLSDLVPLQKPRKTGKCNLRKSLAWDSAFFTSAGVLDAEELSSIIEGTETCAKTNQNLPGIQEDLSKSTDSISTFESDSLTLESLEADLFSDIRASIQRGNKLSTLGDSCGAIAHEGESENGCLKKTVEASSGNMVKPKLPSRKPNPAGQGSGKMSKPGLLCKQATRPPARSQGPSSLITRPPMLTGKQGIGVSKRMFVGHTKPDNNGAETIKDARGAGKGTLAPKGPHQADSRTTLQRAVATSQLPSSVGHRTPVCRSRTSCDSSSTSSSENMRKSQSNVSRKKIDKNVNLPAGCKVKTPSRVPMKNKSQAGESRLSTYVKSTSILSPSISPASSISEWSTESSSSTSTVNQMHGLKHFPTSEGTDSYISQKWGEVSNDKPSDGHGSKVASMLCQSSKQPLTGSDLSLGHPGSSKPSGLKLPSPKIGFFDRVKSGSKTSGGSVRPRSALPSGVPRSDAGTCSPSGPSNRAKLGNTVGKVKTTAAGIPKTDPQITAASTKPTELMQDHSAGSPKCFSGINVANDFGTLSEAPKGISGDSR